MRVDLDVPFADRAKAKQLGAKWDMEKQVWYVQNKDNLWPFLKWMKAAHKKPVASPKKGK